jgi:hypothetical protein
LNWEAIGALADLASAIGVIFTLAYLALQVRQNTRALRAESQRALFENGMATSLQLAQDEQLARLFLKGLQDFHALSEEERTRFSFLMGNLIGQGAVAHGSHAYGVYDRALLTALPGSRFLRTPGGAEWWRVFSKSFSVEFRDYVEQEVLRPNKNTTPADPAA